MIKGALTIFLMPNMVHIDLYQIIKTTDGYDAELSIAAGYQPTDRSAKGAGGSGIHQLTV